MDPTRRDRPRPLVRRAWEQPEKNKAPFESRGRRAGIAGAYLPRTRIPMFHRPMQTLGDALPCCVGMVLERFGRDVPTETLAEMLHLDETTSSRFSDLQRLLPWGYSITAPERSQFFRDATAELDRTLGMSGQLVYAWEKEWLRFTRAALQAGLPLILPVALADLQPAWRGLGQSHAVVLCGGDGRQAWIHDPGRPDGPTRVGLCTLLDALLVNEPLAVALHPTGILLGKERDSP